MVPGVVPGPWYRDGTGPWYRMMVPGWSRVVPGMVPGWYRAVVPDDGTGPWYRMMVPGVVPGWYRDGAGMEPEVVIRVVLPAGGGDAPGMKNPPPCRGYLSLG
ncbi:hypothetical protein ACFQ5F_09835 [Kroppenstedtia eburnea]|uniref:hypothetical protein n=1 Tax=Kroppenstedtia eburnea TaxID=714067 RepID=UPI003645D9B9